MALDNFKEVFLDTYQEHFQKFTVGMESIANSRLQPNLTYGESVTSPRYDFSNVRVRDITPGADRTIDPISDTEELLTINYQKGTSFQLTNKEMVQAGPLQPAMRIGSDAAKKLSIEVDADILYEVTNAHADFDNGSLSGTSPTGVPITLSTSNAEQVISRVKAFLRRNNVDTANTVWVIDAIALSIIEQTHMGKNIDPADNTFKNGYSGPVSGADVFVSENLTGEAVLALATNPTDGDTISINGVDITFVNTLSGGAGEVHIASTVDITRANLAEFLNAPSTSEAEATDTGYAALTGSDLVTIEDLNITATNDDTADEMTIVARGSGRLTVAETLTDGTDEWSKNFIHAYYGKRGTVDVVMQDQVDMEMREEPRQRTTNIFADALYGIKTFEEGADQFLDVLIEA